MKLSQAKSSVSVFVPALNEQDHIESTVETVLGALADARVDDYDIILVNDGSTDRTGDVMDRIATGNPRIQVVHHKQNMGLGPSYRHAIEVAKKDYLLFVTGDTVMPRSSISEILACVGKADIIISYMTDGHERPLGRRIGSAGFTMLMNMLFGLRIPYYNCIVPRCEHLRQITITTASYAFMAEALVKLLKAGHDHVEVGVVHGHHVRRESAALRPTNLIGVVKAILKLVSELRKPAPVLIRTEEKPLSVVAKGKP